MKTKANKTLRVLKRISLGILKTAIVLFGTVLLILIVAVAAFFIAPDIHVPASRLEKLITRFAPADLQIKWDSADLYIRKEGYLSKNISLDLGKICVDYKARAIRSCFDEFRWGVGVSVSGFRPRITYYEPLIARGGDVAGDLAKLESDEPKEEKSGGFSVLDFMREDFLPKWRINGSIVEIKKLDLLTGGRRIRGAVLLETAETFKLSPLSGLADRKQTRLLHSGPETQIARLTVFDFEFGDLVGASLQAHVLWPKSLNDDWLVYADSDVRMAKKQGAKVSLESRIHAWDNLEFVLQAKLRNVAAVREGRLTGTYKGDNLNGLVSAKFGAVHAQVKTLDFVDCGYEVALDKKEAGLKCGPQTVLLGLQERAMMNNRHLFRLAPTFDLRLSRLSWENGIETDWDFKMALSHLKMARLEVDLNGAFSKKDQTDVSVPSLHYSAAGDIMAEIIEFRRLTSLLRTTPFAIPAPLNRLRGPVRLSASGDFTEQGGDLPFELQTRLDSEFQKLNSTIGGRFHLERGHTGLRPSLQINVAMEDVQLSLPRFEVTQSPPRVLPDARFKRGLADDTPPTDPAKGGLPLDYRVRIATSVPGALKIATNVTGAPIPISVRLTTRSVEGETGVRHVAAASRPGVQEPPKKSETVGTVTMGKTPVDFGGINKVLERLERDASLDYFTFQLLPNGERKVDGRFLVKNPDATISILILGTLNQPIVRFESDPPASEDQILAALLFGRPLQELDVSQQESAAAMKTAVNDTALTLLQMYLLTNTPIETLNYDPNTGRVIASVKLATGTSLEFGGGAGAGSEVGIRRRLARNVYLNTYVEDSPQTDEGLVSAFVEWVRRF